jgi:hypothetical protein
LQKVLSVVTLIFAVEEGLPRLASRIMESRWPAGVEMRFAGRSTSNCWCEFARFVRRKFIGTTLDTGGYAW